MVWTHHHHRPCAAPYCNPLHTGGRSLERAIGGYKAVEWAERLDVLASQERGNTGTSDAIQRSEYDGPVKNIS